MRLCLLLFFVSAVLPVFGQNRPTDVTASFGACANCHGVPDSRVSSDNLWISRIASTACVMPLAPKSNKKRHALMKFLRGTTPQRPLLENSARAPRKGEGQVRVPFARGVVLLVPVGKSMGQSVRLAWDPKSKSDSKSLRSIAAGKYQVRNYKIQLLDENGEEWQLWASGQGRTVEVVAGKTAILNIDTGVEVKTTIRARRNKVRLGVAVKGDRGMGATVIHKKERVSARCSLESAEKSNVKSDMAYG